MLPQSRCQLQLLVRRFACNDRWSSPKDKLKAKSGKNGKHNGCEWRKELCNHGRDVVLVDSNPEAIAVMRKRFEATGARFHDGGEVAEES